MQVTFNADMVIQGQWHNHDGLREYHGKGSLLVKKRRCPIPHQGYQGSKALYVKD